MKLKATIKIFSGRPDPVLMLDSKKSSELMRLIEASPVKLKGKEIPAEPSILGYRGITIEDPDAGQKEERKSTIYAVKNIVVRGGNTYRIEKNVEDFILENLDYMEEKTVPRFKTLITEDIKSLYEKWDKITVLDPGPIFLPVKCTCGPLLELEWWNQSTAAGDPQNIRPKNNCYNYASNYRTDNFAQPGMASGNQYTSLAACNVAGVSAKQGAVSDCLIDSPNANNKCPRAGHLVALVIWPNVDYHWYRKDANGYWSHKPGSTAATKYDNSMKLIKDPRSCDRGNYTEFCTFMVVQHGHIKLKGPL